MNGPGHWSPVKSSIKINMVVGQHKHNTRAHRCWPSFWMDFVVSTVSKLVALHRIKRVLVYRVISNYVHLILWAWNTFNWIMFDAESKPQLHMLFKTWAGQKCGGSQCRGTFNGQHDSNLCVSKISYWIYLAVCMRYLSHWICIGIIPNSYSEAFGSVAKMDFTFI